eukprot:CAMPEP_0178401784 /NCGR_PEP_ID=MMETSP0689_2-20121128/16484_1 /TAXON_ID=160604 /ORGANISM="Amphidinium massartii, Strain CS-259" /LENGTH=723 /DNA_ID=CAMNT_0020022623 /DNA_START=88 /DNA_END=2259 /DNA_ORIENTATION=-
MDQETPKEPDPAAGSTESLRVHGRSQWNEPDASLSFDWPGTQIGFRVLGSPAEVNMLASVGEDVLAVYADERFERKIGPGSGRKETFLLLRDAPEECTIRLVKLTESNMSIPITIYALWTSPSTQQGGAAPSIRPFDIEGCHPGLKSTFECVGDSDTSGLYNIAKSALEQHGAGCSQGITSLDSDIEQSWPFFLAESLGVARPMVIALSGVGVLAGNYWAESLSDYYPRQLCCRRHSQNSAPRSNTSAGSSGDPLCVLVLVGGNDFVTMPRDSPSAQSSFLKDFVRAHQALLRSIRQQRPNSPIVSLYGDADSCSGCQSVTEQKFISSNMQRAVLESVAGIGGAERGFFSCLVQPNIQRECDSDWSHDSHWGPTGHQKFAGGVKRALRALALREGAHHKGEQQFPGMAALAAMLCPSRAAAGQASAGAALSQSGTGVAVPDKSTPRRVQQDGSLSASQTAGARLQSWSALSPCDWHSDGHNALTLAIMKGSESAACRMLRQSKYHAFDTVVVARGLRWNVLELLAWHGMEEGVRLFLALHARKKPAAFVHPGAVLSAVDAGHDRILQVLTTHAAVDVPAELAYTQPDRQYGSQPTALHVACKAGHLRAVQCILRLQGCERAINSHNGKDKCTALHIAASEGHDDIASCLLQSDTFTAVNALDSCQCTALHTACHWEQERIAMKIIQDPMFTMHGHKCRNGWTALRWAEELKLPLVIDALRRKL